MSSQQGHYYQCVVRLKELCWCYNKSLFQDIQLTTYEFLTVRSTQQTTPEPRSTSGALPQTTFPHGPMVLVGDILSLMPTQIHSWDTWRTTCLWYVLSSLSIGWGFREKLITAKAKIWTENRNMFNKTVYNCTQIVFTTEHGEIVNHNISNMVKLCHCRWRPRMLGDYSWMLMRGGLGIDYKCRSGTQLF